jgi:uncharacterized phage-like protein YoqJ
MKVTDLPDLRGKTLAFTGHRPDKLGGYSSDAFVKLKNLGLIILQQTKPARVISGMALGWDMAVAYAAIKLKIPVTAAVPFLGQESVWPKSSQDQYQAILNNCDLVVYVSPGGYTAEKMQIRNCWMVDASDHLIALWDGSAGGTQNCVRYAQATRLRMDQPGFTNVWPLWLEHKDKP